MLMYHGTTEKNWQEIKNDGVLYGRKNELWYGKPMDRLTYLTPHKEIAQKYGPIILEVDIGDMKDIEYKSEYAIYDPIPLSKIRVVTV